MFLFIVAVLTSCLIGCRADVIHITVHNNSKDNVFNMTMVYGSGSYSIQSLKPGATHVKIVEPIYLNQLEFRFMDKDGRIHFPYIGPPVGYKYHGEVDVYIEDDFKVRFDSRVHPTLGVEQTIRTPSQETPHAAK